MGLDNGIIIKNKTRKQLPLWLKYPFEKDCGEGVEICYWRKWWGFRNEVMHKFTPIDAEEPYYINLKREDIRTLFYILEFYLKYPDAANNGYWEPETTRKIIQENLWNLFWLYWYMLFHPNLNVYFYDSY